MKRAVGFGVLLVFACAADRSPRAASLSTLAASTKIAADTVERYYRAENDAAIEAYVERARRRGRTATRTERCRLPSGALSRRPTVLQDPPLAWSSIDQREKLVVAIGAYLDTLATVADRSNDDVVTASLARLTSKTIALRAVADRHGAGDLFIDELAGSLSDAVAAAGDARRTAPMSERLARVDAIVRRLTTILTTDAARQRRKTSDATQLAYRSWVDNPGGVAADATEVEPPFCSEPAIRHDEANEDGSAGRVTTTTGARLRERMNAARTADPTLVSRALAALDEDEMHVVEHPDSAAYVEEAANGRAAFERAVKRFANDFPEPR